MKLIEFQQTQVPQKHARERLTDAHLQAAYDLIKDQEFDRQDINQLAKELEASDQFDRTKSSARFLLNRMHILVHGIAPFGESEATAEAWYAVPDTMISFVERKGYDAVGNIEKAKVELKSRPPKISHEEATRLMFDYYMAHKDTLPKNISMFRDQIVADLQQGKSAEEVFAQYAAQAPVKKKK